MAVYNIPMQYLRYWPRQAVWLGRGAIPYLIDRNLSSPASASAVRAGIRSLARSVAGIGNKLVPICRDEPLSHQHPELIGRSFAGPIRYGVSGPRVLLRLHLCTADAGCTC